MEKVIITKAEIEKDIIHAIKHPARTPRWLYFVGYAAVFVVMLGIAFLESYIGKAAFFLPAVVLFAILLLPLVKYGLRDRKAAKVSIDNYVVKKSVVKKKKHEKYVKISKRRITVVNNYNIFFEKERVWRIPDELYWWSEKCSMSDISVFEKTEQGDVFYTVCEKKSGKIVMAYNTEVFEYEA
ncbi:MAG: hypothetical protein II987_00855 [Clostridia bacterium]|nr:hypothetical protein [Clostridia bacterium]